MELPFYNVKITISDPDDDETQISITLDRILRDKLLTVKIPLAGMLAQFEESVK